MHHIFVNENIVDLANKIITLHKNDDEETYNHLVKSLRVNAGEQVLCSVMPFELSFDYLCVISDISNDGISLSIIEETSARELKAKINLYQGISKSDKLEFIIEKAVELGVSEITPLSTEYCIAKIDEKKNEKKIERFNKIAKSAAEQSKRHIIPKVNEPMKFGECIDRICKKAKDANSTYNLLFYENATGISGTRDVIREIKRKIEEGLSIEVNVIIGPEGGFSDREIEKAKETSEVNILSLGDRILRTETAAITALSILMYELA
jgi:16S rRNA (uracil1498-N3)-methyltransferase